MFSGIFSEADKNTVLPMNKTTGTEGSSYLYNSRGETGFTRTMTGGKRRTKKRNGGCWTKKNRGGKSHRRRRSRYTRTRK
jgi:hypothetical protein